MAAYVTSQVFSSSGMNANIPAGGSLFATAPVPFSFTADAGDFLIFGDMNDNGLGAESAGVSLIEDDGGNTWFHFLLSPAIAGNILWGVILSNPITQISVTWHRAGSGTVNAPTIIVGRYTGFSPQVTQTDNTSVSEVHSTIISSQQIGFVLAGNTGAATFAGPDLGGIVRQIGGDASVGTGAQICLIDNLTGDTVSQTMSASVPNLSFHGFFQNVATSGNIVIQKQTIPSGSSQVFTFTPSYSGLFTLTDGQSNDSGPLAPGTYSVSEAPVAGWTTTTSSDPSNIVVTAGATTTVTFTNTFSASAGNIVVQKVTNPTGSAQSFIFHPSWGGGGTFTLTDGTSQDSGPLTPGTYSVSEDAIAGWTTTTSTDPTNLVVTSGATTTVTFTNTATGGGGGGGGGGGTGTIIVSKVTNPPGSPQAFTFHPSWGSVFTLLDGQSQTATGLAAGTYSITEDAVSGWTTTTSANPASLIVTSGQTTSITFTNTQAQGTCPGKAIKALTQVDTWELDNGINTWPADRGVPYAWHENTLPQQTLSVAPTPDDDGTIELLYVALAQAMTGLGVNLAIPDDWTPYIVWGTLAELLSSDGPAFDPVRAEYCQRRFQEGIELARLVLGG